MHFWHHHASLPTATEEWSELLSKKSPKGNPKPHFCPKIPFSECPSLTTRRSNCHFVPNIYWGWWHNFLEATLLHCWLCNWEFWTTERKLSNHTALASPSRYLLGIICNMAVLELPTLCFLQLKPSVFEQSPINRRQICFQSLLLLAIAMLTLNDPSPLEMLLCLPTVHCDRQCTPYSLSRCCLTARSQSLPLVKNIMTLQLLTS